MTIEDVSTNFFSQITLHRVSVAKTGNFSSGIAFQSEKIILHNYLWNYFIPGRDFNSTELSIYFVHPRLDLSGKTTKIESSFSFLENERVLRRLKLYLSEGEICFSVPTPKNGTKEIVMKKITGQIIPQIRKKSWFFSFSVEGKTKLEKDTDFSLEGVVYPALYKYNLKLGLSGFNLGEIYNFTDNSVLKNLSGLTKLNLRLQGNLPGSKNDQRWTNYAGHLQISGINLRLVDYSPPLNLDCELDFTPSKIKFSSCRLDWGENSFNTQAEVKIKNQSIDSLLSSGWRKDLQLEFQLSKGDFSSKKGKLNNLQLKGMYQLDKFILKEMSVAIGKGFISVNGEGEKDNYFAEIAGSHISGTELAKFFPDLEKLFPNTADFKINLEKNREKLICRGEAAVRVMKIFNYSVPEIKLDFKSWFDKNGEFLLRGKDSVQDYEFGLNGNIKDKLLVIKDGKLLLNPEEKVEFSGKVDWQNEILDLKIFGNNIKFGRTVSSNKYYSGLSGNSTFTVFCQGKLKNPLLKGEVKINSASLLFSYQERTLKITEFSSNSYRGNLIISFTGESPQLKLKGNFNFNQGDKPLLSGRLLGTVEKNPHNGYWRGNLQTAGLLFRQKKYGEFFSKFDYFENVLSFSQLKLGEFFFGKTTISFVDKTTSPSLTGEGGYFLLLKDILPETDGNILGNWFLTGTISEPKLEGSIKIKGKNFSLSAAGSFFINDPANFSYQGKIQEGEAYWKDEHWDKLNADFSGTSKSLVFKYLKAASSGKEWSLNEESKIEFGRNNKILFHLPTEMRNIDIFGFVFFGGVDLDGSWDYSQENSVAEVTLNCRDLWVNQHDFEKNKIKVELRRNQLRFLPVPGETYQWSGRIDWSASPAIINFSDIALAENKNVLLRIRGLLGKEIAQEVVVEGNDIDNSILLELADTKISSMGKTSFYLQLKGAIENPYIYGNLNMAKGEIADLPYDFFNLNFDYFQSLVSFNNLEIFQKKKYSLSGRGNIPLGSRKDPFSLYFVLKEANLDILSKLAEDIKKGRGSAKGWINISGSKDEPSLDGYLAIGDGEIYAGDIFKKVTDLDLELVIKKNHLRINKSWAKIGLGELILNGDVVFKGLYPEKYNLHLFTPGREIALLVQYLTIPQTGLFKRLNKFAVPSTGDCKIDLELTGEAENPKLKGNLELVNTHFTYPAMAAKANGGTNAWLKYFIQQLFWDVNLKAGKNVWYENEYVSILIKGDLQLQGQGESFTVNAHFESEKGDLNYLGNNFTIKNVIFDVVDNIPYLAGSAETEITIPETRGSAIQTTDTVTMVIEKGKLGEKTPRFYSKNYPSLSEEKILASVTGLEGITSSPDKEIILRREIVKLLDASLATPIIKNILRRTGLVDIIRVSRVAEPVRELPGTYTPATLPEVLKGTKYTLGKYFSSKLLLEYSLRLDNQQNKLDLRHEAELVYRLINNIYLHGTDELPSNNLPGREQNRSIFLEHQSRFGRVK
ncbi:MAG: translocation/assembly module TamB domain-containing protein [Elusimicrobiota bacterium]